MKNLIIIKNTGSNDCFLYYANDQKKITVRRSDVRNDITAILAGKDGCLQSVITYLGYQGGTVHQMREELQKIRILSKPISPKSMFNRKNMDLARSLI